MKRLKYHYKAIDTKGALQAGFLRSKDLNTARRTLIEKEWMILELKASENEDMNQCFNDDDICVSKRSWRSRLRFRVNLPKQRKISSKQLLHFTQNVSSLLSSGLSLAASLRILLEKEKSLNFKNTLTHVMHAIEEGASFSDALLLSKVAWDDTYIRAIQAADCSGRLEAILEMLQMELERKVEFESKIRSALIYPAFILILSISVTLILLMFVVPQFSSMLSYLTPNTKLPLGTRCVLFLSQFIRDFWIFILIALPIVGLGCECMLQANYLQRRIHGMIQHVPFIGRTLRLIEIERVLHTLHVLIVSGTPLIEGLERVQQCSNSTSVKSALLRTYQRVLEGSGFSDALGVETVFPLWLKDNLRIGEQSGSLDEVLKKSAYSIRKEVDHKLKLATTFIEPILILGLAIVIGGLVISLFWPILEVIQQMSEF